jgi:hypothetical protein
MKRERYKGHVLVAKADKVRGQRIWTARVFIERFIAGGWQDLPIPGLEGQAVRRRSKHTVRRAIARAPICGWDSATGQ